MLIEIGKPGRNDRPPHVAEGSRLQSEADAAPMGAGQHVAVGLVGGVEDERQHKYRPELQRHVQRKLVVDNGECREGDPEVHREDYESDEEPEQLLQPYASILERIAVDPDRAPGAA